MTNGTQNMFKNCVKIVSTMVNFLFMKPLAELAMINNLQVVPKKFQVNPTKIVSTTAHFHKDHFWKFSGSVWPGGST